MPDIKGDNLPDEIEAPVEELIGLAFQYLHGSIAFVEKQLSLEPPNLRHLHIARTQLSRALAAFSRAALDSDRSSFIDRQYVKLAEGLLRDSHTVLETASFRLSSSLRSC